MEAKRQSVYKNNSAVKNLILLDLKKEHGLLYVTSK
jgi:hypothetical protein